MLVSVQFYVNSVVLIPSVSFVDRTTFITIDEIHVADLLYYRTLVADSICTQNLQFRILPFVQVPVLCVSLRISFASLPTNIMIGILLLLPAKGAPLMYGKSEFNVEGSTFDLGYVHAMLGSGKCPRYGSVALCSHYLKMPHIHIHSDVKEMTPWLGGNGGRGRSREEGSKHCSRPKMLCIVSVPLVIE